MGAAISTKQVQMSPIRYEIFSHMPVLGYHPPDNENVSMALYLSDPEVDALLAELQRLTGAPTKTHVLKTALKNAVAQARGEKTLSSKLARAKSLADGIGSNDAAFDIKAFCDENWEG